MLYHYLNWDADDDREAIVSGVASIAEKTKLDFASEQTSIIVFDEIHKYDRWKQLLKGFYDKYHHHRARYCLRKDIFISIDLVLWILLL